MNSTLFHNKSKYCLVIRNLKLIINNYLIFVQPTWIQAHRYTCVYIYIVIYKSSISSNGRLIDSINLKHL